MIKNPFDFYKKIILVKRFFNIRRNEMKKQIIRIGLILLVAIFAILITNVNASSIVDSLNSGLSTSTSAKTSVVNTSKTVLSAIKIIGAGIAIIMLLFIAIKYMMSSPDGKAEYKKTALIYVVGAVVLFAAPQFVELVMKMSQNLTGKL